MTVNDAELTARFSCRRSSGILGQGPCPAGGERITGAEDFSYFSQVVPGFDSVLGVVPDRQELGRPPHADLLCGRRVRADRDARLMTALVVDS